MMTYKEDIINNFVLEIKEKHGSCSYLDSLDPINDLMDYDLCIYEFVTDIKDAFKSCKILDELLLEDIKPVYQFALVVSNYMKMKRLLMTDIEIQDEIRQNKLRTL